MSISDKSRNAELGVCRGSLRGFVSVRCVLYYVCCLLYFLPFLGAQAIETGTADPYFKNSIIRVSSSLVSVPVSVTDASGRGIADLLIEDLRVEEDGRPAEISRLSDSSQSNLNIAVLFDISGSVNPNFKFEQDAAVNFLKKIWKEGDAVTIVSFDQEPVIRLKSGDNLQEAMWTLRQLRPTEKTTSFFDAVILAARHIDQQASEETRQAMIVISDGADNTSKSNLTDALAEMQRRDAVFYAINPSGASVRLNRINIKGQENLETLARATGGAVFVTDDISDLGSIFGKIESELRAQYLLHYYSPSQRMDGKFHSIEVSIPGQPELNIRARPGFLDIPR